MHAHHALLNLFVVVSTKVTPTRHTGWHDNLCYTSARLLPAERDYLSASHRMCVQITEVAFYAFLTTRMLQTAQSRVFDFSLFLALKIRCALHLQAHLQACRDWVITICQSLILQRFSSPHFCFCHTACQLSQPPEFRHQLSVLKPMAQHYEAGFKVGHSHLKRKCRQNTRLLSLFVVSS